MKDYEDIKNFDDLVHYRFSRFGEPLDEFFIVFITRFFKSFLRGYLEFDGDNFVKVPLDSEPIKDYKPKKKDLYELAESKFGIFCFHIIDEVIVNKMLEKEELELKEIEDTVLELLEILELIIHDFHIIPNEHYQHSDNSDRLDHLKTISFNRYYSIVDLYKKGVFWDASGKSKIKKSPKDVVLDPEIVDMDYTISKLQGKNIVSKTLTHLLLSWIFLSKAIDFIKGQEVRERLFAGIKNEIPPFVILFLKFGIVFLTFYLIFENKNILKLFNLNDEYHWVISIFFLTLLYLPLRHSEKKDTNFQINHISQNEKIELFHIIYCDLSFESYHPELIRNKLNDLENKDLYFQVPESMYALINQSLQNNSFISKPNSNRYFYKWDDPKTPLSAKHNESSFKPDEVIFIRKDNTIQWKYRKRSQKFDLEISSINLDMTIKPEGKTWQINSDWENKKEFTESQSLNYELENISIGYESNEGGYSSFQKDSIFVIDKDKLVFPKIYEISLRRDTELVNKLKNYYGIDLDEFTEIHELEPEPLGRIYFQLFPEIEKPEYYRSPSESQDRGIIAFIGLRDDIYEKVFNQTYNGDVQAISFNTKCVGYSNDDWNPRDLILDQFIETDNDGKEHTVTKTVLKINDLSIKFTN